MENRADFKQHPLILFDGFCNLCNASVQSIIKRDPQAVFRFASLQSESAQELLKQLGQDKMQVDSIILVTDREVFIKSTAVLEICRSLNGMLRFLYVLRIVPESVRDRLYDWIAGNRYAWFGRRDICMVPDPELENRFIG